MLQRFFCSTCETKRPVIDHRCVLCGTPVRLYPIASEHAEGAVAQRGEPMARGRFVPGWRGIAVSKAERDLRVA